MIEEHKKLLKIYCASDDEILKFSSEELKKYIEIGS